MVIEGVVEDIIYKNAENGYCVLRLETKDDGIVAVGTLPLVSEGETLEIEGDYTEHKTYGRQFSVTSFRSRIFRRELSKAYAKRPQKRSFPFSVPIRLTFSKTNPNVSAR